METIMPLVLIFSLLPSVHGDNSTMECASCYLGESCQHKVNCTDAGMICVSLEVGDTFGGGSSDGVYKGCTSPRSCTPLVLTMSVMPGRQVRSNLACCATSGCNDQLTLSVPSTSSWKNGMYCPACENQNSSLCEGQTDTPCTGAEESCISLEGVSIGNSNHNFSMRGCATPSACTMKENDLMSFGGDVYRLTRNATCTNMGSLGALPSLATLVFQGPPHIEGANVPLLGPSYSKE
ncbi:phospholipase A2 inhibitor and Ly6/PLAUR domain-containing protein-like [Sphaerodactylus townsendi]|uniref:phospholipase A2 inhibitor and Ly6/PLAUR domain-containing protein-like n=1 Tax=Sphaerodactylus townsendi TaxID=933632 RepID=UPI0020260517|nr:phospholipase A2 inhibitor and Ly6/PLAUR domain-containing protein-like [Sphaerodactylus townsendi]